MFAISRLIILTAAFLLSSNALAGLTFSLSGSGSDSHIGLKKASSKAVTGSVAVDLGMYFRIGLTHRQKNDISEGYVVTSEEDAETKIYAAHFSQNTESTNSLDLTIVLYAGQLITPYIFGGAALKSYTSYAVTAGETPQGFAITMPVPTGGFGFGLRINKQFSIKYSHTLTPGWASTPGGEVEKQMDSYSQMGLSYRM